MALFSRSSVETVVELCAHAPVVVSTVSSSTAALTMNDDVVGWVFILI